MHKARAFVKRIKLTNFQLAAITFVAGVCTTAIVLALVLAPEGSLSRLVSLPSPLPTTETIETPDGIIRQARLPILMYHHVGKVPPNANAVRKGLTVSSEAFEKQVSWLHEQGYTSITLAQLLAYEQGKFTMPAKPVIFTFDDGYIDVFDNAAPILKKYGFVGSFGVITQFPGINTGDNQYATWEQIKAASQQGMEIVSHTQDHFDGTAKGYNDIFILNNLQGSQADIKSRLGKAEPILIYPYGHYDERYIRLAKKAGFVMGLTTREGTKIDGNRLMEIPRVRIAPNYDLEMFKRLVTK